VKTETITNVDTVFIEIKNKSSKVIVGLIYISPGQAIEIDYALSESIFETNCRSEVAVMVDFNLPVTRWGDLLNIHTRSDLYTNLIQSELYQHVNSPTRDNKILALIFSTNENLVNEVKFGPVFADIEGMHVNV